MRETLHRSLRFVGTGHCLGDSEDQLGEALKLEPTVMSAIMLAEFEEWLTQRNNALAIPMTVVARTPGSIRLTFVGVIDAIEVFVLLDELVVAVQYKEICWDILAEFECTPVHVADGFVCSHCAPADRQVYATYSALLGDHVFEPLARWIGTSLMPARALGLGGNCEHGNTWAGLIPAEQRRDYSAIVPLRTLSVASLL
jgi:hypothetical protein